MLSLALVEDEMRSMREASKPHRMRRVTVEYCPVEPHHALQSCGTALWTGRVRLAGRVELDPIALPACEGWIVVHADELFDDAWDGWRNAPCPSAGAGEVGSDGSGDGWPDYPDPVQPAETGRSRVQRTVDATIAAAGGLVAGRGQLDVVNVVNLFKGTEGTTGDDYTPTSSAPAVATVAMTDNPRVRVTPLGAGTATIEVVFLRTGERVEFSVTVSAPPAPPDAPPAPPDAPPAPQPRAVPAEEAQRIVDAAIAAAGLVTDGSPVDVAVGDLFDGTEGTVGDDYMSTSSDLTVATVEIMSNLRVRITPVGLGTTTIQVIFTRTGARSEFSVTVSPPPPPRNLFDATGPFVFLYVDTASDPLYVDSFLLPYRMLGGTGCPADGDAVTLRPTVSVRGGANIVTGGTPGIPDTSVASWAMGMTNVRFLNRPALLDSRFGWQGGAAVPVSDVWDPSPALELVGDGNDPSGLVPRPVYNKLGTRGLPPYLPTFGANEWYVTDTLTFTWTQVSPAPPSTGYCVIALADCPSTGGVGSCG